MENSIIRLGKIERQGRQVPVQYEREVCVLDVILFSAIFYISAPSVIGLLLPAAGL